MVQSKRSLQPHWVDRYVGRRLQDLRVEKGLSRVELSARVGVSFQHIAKYEAATHRISASMLIALADALGASADAFFPPSAPAGELRLPISVRAAEARELARLFANLSAPERRRLIAFAHELATMEEVEASFALGRAPS